MDHDFHYSDIIPLVTLWCNIPKEVSGSLFSGGEDGFGQIFVTLRDVIFDPSYVYAHTAQLVDTIVRESLTPTVRVLQTDGGPDHSLKRLATKLVMIACFKSLTLDHLLVLRCAPNGSAYNQVERSIYVLNLGLTHVSLKRKRMDDWDEDAAISYTCMQSVRDIAQKKRR